MGFTPTFLGLTAATRNSIRSAKAACKVKQFPFRGVLTVLAVAALWLSSGPFARGQSTSGSIVGSAVDTSDAMVPDATITITNEQTGFARESPTSATGTFAVSNLLPGIYTVKATLTGFKSWVRSGVVVRLNQATIVDISLELGAITESVEVSGTVPLLQTTEATVGHVVEQRRVVQLPLNGRDFTQLQLLVPGTAPATLPGASFVIGGQAVAVSGNRPDQNSYTLDGTYNNETFFKHYGIRPSIDAIQEFNIQTNITSARYGVGGAHVDIATRSGSNTVHGSVFEFLRNDVLNANDFFRNASPPPAGETKVARPSFRMNQFGGTLGGPLTIPKVYKGRDKTFFFLNYEGLRVRRESTILGIVPTSAQLAGDLSLDSAGNSTGQIFNPFTTCGFAGNPACTDINGFDAEGVLTGLSDGKINAADLTRQPFLGNIIPSNMISPVARVYLDMFYGLNSPNRTVPGDLRNLLNSTPVEVDTDQFTIRLDHQVTSNNTVFARFSNSIALQKQPLVLPSQVRTRLNSFNNFTLNNTHVFSPTLVLEVKYGYARDNIPFSSQYPAPGFQALLDAGLKGLPPTFAGFGSPLNLTVASPFQAGLGSGISSPDLGVFINGPDTNHQSIVNLMKIKGRHTINVGMEVKRATMLHDGQFAEWNFTSLATANPQSTATSGSGLASLMLGLPSQASRIVGFAVLNGIQTNYHFHLQDDIKLTSNLTMNIGLRYEYSQWFRYRDNNLGAYDSSIDQFVWTGHNFITNEPPNTRPTFVDPDWNNFAPRLGFAYRLGNRTTIRTGYGIFYAGLMTWEASMNRGNWPYTASQALAGLNTEFPVNTFSNVFPEIDLNKVPRAAQHTAQRRNRWPYIQQWNIHIQRELANDLLFEVGYVGSRGLRLNNFASANDPPPGPGVVGSPEHPRPHPNQDAFSEQLQSDSKYHSLQAKVERRFTHGLSLLTAYTWSKNLDMASAFDGDSPQDWQNRRASFGRSSFDLRHSFVVSSIYELPFGPGRSSLNAAGPAGKLLEGWDITSILRFHSGFPYNVRLGFDNANIGARGDFLRPDLVGDPNLPESQRTPERWFNTDAFAIPTQFTFGNVGRNTMIGPGFSNVDISLHKTTSITERHKIEFRVEFFNVFNNVNFANPISDMSSTFGTISSTRSPSPLISTGAREIQFALKYLF